ncbi:MAG: adenylate cyclase [Leptospiraceae bacterium]|nr:adenylate cyclase [Leptospiraceae bacterium]MCP5500669.1 adenylate cyclase [Leptospiraceae bacterium]
MSKLRLFIFITFVSIFACIPVQATGSIVVDSQFQKLVLGKYLEYYEDKTGKLTIEEVSNPEFAKKFIRSRVDKPNFGFTNSTFWVKFQLTFNISKEKEFLLEHSYPNLDNIQFYSYEKNTWRKRQTGDHFIFQQRDLKNKNFIFKIKAIPREKALYLMRLQSTGSMQIPLTLYDNTIFIENLNNERFALGFYYGIIFVMLVYNLSLFFSLKDSTFIYYVLYLFSFLLVQMGYNGISFEYLWNNSPIMNSFLLLFISFTEIFLFLFTKKILNINSNFPKLNFLFYGFLSAFSILGFCSLNTSIYFFTSLGLATLTITGLMLLFISGLHIFLIGYKPARFYILAFSTLILGTVSFGLTLLGILPTNIFTENAMQIGSALESILLSLAVGDKIMFMRKEKDLAKNELIRTQHESIKNKKKLIQSYARFVPEELLRFLNKDIITKVNLGDAVEKKMTVLFSDIRSFTTISELMTPEESFHFINSYLNKIAPCIRKYNGYIDKFIGDGIMALFPLSPKDAIQAAIEMLEELHLFNQERMNKGLEKISIGIGIHTGKQMVGIIGEKERLEGTVISDVVNTSSRLEGLTKAYSCSLIISKDVLEYSKDITELSYRLLDTVKVKGKNQSVKIYEVLNGNSNRIIELKLKTKNDFETGIENYQQKNFEIAVEYFQKVKRLDPKDKASELYLTRCEFYLKNGVSPDWDGVEKLDFK